ncbi:MAG: hypothetical protein ANABAC_1298 [Anaerolineae bacterium]|nr:MAG: hypothetical protein ANABAC_1298 [Anaerolineae bacterium]
MATAIRDSLQVFTPILMALTAAYIVYYLFSGLNLSVRRQAVKSLSDYYRPLEDQATSTVKIGSMEHKIRLAALSYGVKVDGKEMLVFYSVIAVICLCVLIAVQALNLPIVLIPAGMAIGYVFVKGVVEGRWDKMRVALEKELPAFLLRLAATLQATQNIIEAIADVIDTLDPQAPLKAWLQRMVSAMQSSGQKGLEDMRQEAANISPSLMMVVLEISRLWETGGSGYIQSFQLAAQGLSNLLAARANAQAKADGAWGTIRVILLALGGAIFMAMANPSSGYLFHSPLGQMGLLILLVWGAVGWNILGDAIREVTE